MVIATGSQTKFLGVDGAPQHTYPLRTLDDAVALRDRILSNFERALTFNDSFEDYLPNLLIISTKEQQQLLLAMQELLICLAEFL